MSGEPRLFTIEPTEQVLKVVDEVDFSALDLRERNIQEWIAARPDILSDDLLIVAKAFGGFDRTRERADLVAVDREGCVVVIELKLDDTGSDVHWQAIKYASYFNKVTSPEVIVQMLRDHAQVEQSEAESQLVKHLHTGDMSDLNRRQRVILASHRFAPEVTSAVLWLNEQSVVSDLITCVKLNPYRDRNTGLLYLQATTFLPVLDTEKLQIGIGLSAGTTGVKGQQDDAITHFLYEVDAHVVKQLDPALQPDKRSRWAGVASGYRYYHFRYLAPPWSNWSMKFEINLHDTDETGTARADIGLSCDKNSLQSEAGFSEQEYSKLKDRLEQIRGSELGNLFRLHDDYPSWDGMWFGTSVQGNAMTDEFRESIQATMVDLIKTVKPAIDDLLTEWNER